LHEEFVRKSPRLQAVALLPLQDPEAAVAELERSVRQLGLVGAMLAADGNHVLGDARFTPIYETAQKLNVMVGIHASGSHLGGAGVDLFPQFIQAHTCSHAFGQMRQITSIVFEGIPERFPDLKIAFLEAGCGWAPYWMERMDDEYAKRAPEAPNLKKKPSDYVRLGKIYFSCEADEWLLPQAVKLVGENQIVYASDFPHWDNSYPQSLNEIRDRGDLSDAQKRKILSDNARRLYGLKNYTSAPPPAWCRRRGVRQRFSKYGTSATTVFLRNSSAPFTSSAVWLCSTCCHHLDGRNSGMTTVTMWSSPSDCKASRYSMSGRSSER